MFIVVVSYVVSFSRAVGIIAIAADAVADLALAIFIFEVKPTTDGSQ